MRRRLFLAAIPAVVVLGFAPVANAADGDGGSSTVTATVANIGTRSVTLVAPIALLSAQGTAALQAPYAVTVTETTRQGTNPWSITGDIGTLTSGSDTIVDSALSVSDRSVLQTLGGGTSAAPSGAQDFTAARTLFTNTGQDSDTDGAGPDTATLYTGTYAGSGNVNLTPPDGTKTGLYTGTFTVTLVQ